MIVKIGGICVYQDCGDPATHMACGGSFSKNGKLEPGHPDPACYCQKHARIVADEDGPEFHTHCPNCGCLFGV